MKLHIDPKKLNRRARIDTSFSLIGVAVWCVTYLRSEQHVSAVLLLVVAVPLAFFNYRGILRKVCAPRVRISQGILGIGRREIALNDIDQERSSITSQSLLLYSSSEGWKDPLKLSLKLVSEESIDELRSVVRLGAPA